nr:hypothetical protein [Desulfohalovibrio reitneri]
MAVSTASREGKLTARVTPEKSRGLARREVRVLGQALSGVQGQDRAAVQLEKDDGLVRGLARAGEAQPLVETGGGVQVGYAQGDDADSRLHGGSFARGLEDEEKASIFCPGGEPLSTPLGDKPGWARGAEAAGVREKRPNRVSIVFRSAFDPLVNPHGCRRTQRLLLFMDYRAYKARVFNLCRAYARRPGPARQPYQDGGAT